MDSGNLRPPMLNRQLKEERDFWIEKLSRALEGSKLSPGFEAESGPTANTVIVETTFPPGVTRWLSQVTNDSALLLYTALLAALKICLYRYSGSKSVITGSPPRRRDGDQEPRANALAIIDHIDEAQTFRQFLFGVRETLLEAYARQTYPFVQLVKKLGIASPDDACPLLDVVLRLEDFHGALSDVRSNITISVKREAGELRASIQSHTRSVQAENIERLAGHWIRVLEQAKESIDTPLGEFDLLTEAERRQILVEWNRTDRPLAKTTLHQLFELQAERTPEAVAVVSEDEQLSYAELNARANQLARHLQTLGVREEMLVGILMERRVGLIVALLGVLKAGGAYVPLDATSPKKRLSFMLEDARVAVLLTQERLRSKLPERHTAQVVCVDRQAEVIAQHKRENIPGQVTAENTAYVIYTSGSTGSPKGVCCSHLGVVNLLAEFEHLCPHQAGDRYSLYTSLSFDVSVYEIFSALCTGGALYLPAEEVRFSGAAFAGWLESRGINRAYVPPFMLRDLAEYLDNSAQHSSLRRLLVGVEPIAHSLLAGIQERVPELCIINGYGPTEATICATLYRVPAVDLRRHGNTPIGRPVANTRAYLLDERLRPVPVGIPGELHIGGAGLARGYLNRPELTAEKFIPDIFSAGANARLYRTGDLARYLPDGNIEFVGRLDHQIKVRGFRVEPGEVETVLAQHPGIREAVVTAWGQTSESKQLVAYFVPQGEPVVTADELRPYLRDRLPEYMVPSAFVMLKALPLARNGKLDRRALPPPEALRRAPTELVAPRSPIEEVLTGIWAQALGLEQISVDEDFFALGGHSLLATKVMWEVREVFGVELELRALFAHPTVRELALVVERACHADIGVDKLATLPIPPRSRDGDTPLSYSQQRLWFIDQFEAGSSLYNIPVALRLTGELDTSALEYAFTEVINRHEILRTTFAMRETEVVQLISPAAPFHLPLIDLSVSERRAAEREVSRFIAEESQLPFNLQAGPLLRVNLLRLSTTEHVLTLTAHHIISDGWSMNVLLNEIALLYTGYVTGQPASLPVLPIQYADFAAWQREHLTGELLERQEKYWLQHLKDVADAVLELPTDHARPAVQTHEGAQQRFVLTPELSRELKAFSRTEGATLFMTLLAAWQCLLYRYSGQRDISIGSPVAARTHPQTEPLIGCFVNTLVLRTRLGDQLSFRQLLAEVRETALAALAHQEVPFERVVERLQPERSLSHSPLFQVMFMMQNAPQKALRLPGLELHPMSSESVKAKFDLTLAMGDGEAGLEGYLEYSTDLFEAATIDRMIGHFKTVLANVVADPDQKLWRLPLLSEGESEQLLRAWNATQVEYASDSCVHELFESQAERTPEDVAVIFNDEEISYRELDARANQLARQLQKMGVGAEVLVGICVERSIEMVIGLLGVLKAGGAYLPLDPAYPQERLALILEDAGCTVLLTQSSWVEKLRGSRSQVICLDTARQEIEAEDTAQTLRQVTPDNLAYVIYTSGSTGIPKGVMITHRNVVNFFAGMDGCLQDESAGTWLAVTSLSFDISVLELLWTLARGFRVVIQRAQLDVAERVATSAGAVNREMEFSLAYFASDNKGTAQDRYRLLLEGVRFADQHGFAAVWTPERHFHAFGGLYPNPSITSAALAMITERIRICAGSVVLPLHNPIRVAEEWSVVDNLSNGRVAISFASGWHVDDFVFAPENYLNRKEIMLRDIEIVRRLWRGEAVAARGGAGNELHIKISPRPIQAELPVWLTAAGHPETFRLAGEIGANMLTHLVGQSIDELAQKIAIYREARAKSNHDPASGHVTLMIHTFVGPELGEVKDKVHEPLYAYLKSSADLVRNLARSTGLGSEVDSLTKEDTDALLSQAFDRYFETSGLFGTPETCLRMIERLKLIGVDEVACLIDFGVEADEVISALPYLNIVRERSRQQTESRRADYSLAAQINRHHVTHLQCTPSMARMFCADADALKALGTVPKLLLGGEALPVSVAKQLGALMEGDLYNMYGPTETTVWSTTHKIEQVNGTIPLGRPIANTEIYILDRHLQPLPVGVPGELYIGGAGVGRGYLSRPELTAAKFIPDPFGRVAGARLYRTGDQARYLPDGNIEFLGRVDRQVKLHGYRIELGEIESLLNQCPGVREAAVTVREEAPDDKALVAYVVKAQETTQNLGRRRAAFAQESPPHQPQHIKLPNGMVVSHLSALHAHGAYREIFEEEIYFKHGITLHDGACVFDVGANIGMFTLFAHQRCPDAKIYAFEPIPAIFRVLQSNVASYGVNARLYQCGLAENEGDASFTFYPELPGLSGRYADPEARKETALSLIFENSAVPDHLRASLKQDEVDEALNQRFRSETYTCPLRTLSDVIGENSIERIDLLKIDVEKSEFDVLAGIREEDWAKIEQLVLEIESRELLDKISALLERHGYDFFVEQMIDIEGQANQSGVHVYMLYAVRRSGSYRPGADQAQSLVAATAPASNGDKLSVSGLRSYLKNKVPEYMLPASFVFLESLPLTPNGKIDYRALPAPQPELPEMDMAVALTAPRNEVEQLIAGIWQEELRLRKVGVHDNFFDLGGHSLMALRVRSKIQERLHRELSIVNLFKYPTIDSLARYLSQEQDLEPRFEEVQERADKQKKAINRQQQLLKARKKIYE